MKHLRALLPAALILFVAGCGQSIYVKTNYNPSTNFSRIHTYSWLKVNSPNSLWADRIRRDVNGQLAAKGWMEIPSGGQAAVSAFSATKNQRSLETFYNGFGPGFGGWYWGGFGLGAGFTTTQVVNTPIGSLVVDIFNSSDKHLIWRGYARRALSSNPNDNRQTLENTVVKMFKNFPPAQG